MNKETEKTLRRELMQFNAKKQIGVDLLNQHRKRYGNDLLTLVCNQPEVRRRPWYAVWIHPSTREPGKVEMSTFDEWGFSGHELFKTPEEAAADAYLRGFRYPAPRLLDRMVHTPKFVAGTRWAMLPEDKKWNTSMDELLAQVQP
jgi:hypothetical protein